MANISVIIPCFNAGRYLDASIQSALDQDYADLEVIVVDDGSTDPATLESLDKWKSASQVMSGLTVLQQTNRGPAAARNAGIAASSGKYFLPLDADDFIDETYARKAKEVLEANPDIGIVYSRVMLHGEGYGRFTRKNGKEQEWDLPKFDLNKILFENQIVATSMFRRSDWQLVGGYDETMRESLEDYDFVLKILGLGREVHRIDEILFYYRIHENSRTAQSFQGDSRSKLVRAKSTIFRNNLSLYAENAEGFWREQLKYADGLNELKHRYRYLERIRRATATQQLVKVLRSLKSRTRNFARRRVR